MSKYRFLIINFFYFNISIISLLHSNRMTYEKRDRKINNINDVISDKIYIANNNYYCSNCNERGHTYKKCYEPIISNGIISFYIENFNKNKLESLEKYIGTQIKKKSTNIKIPKNHYFYDKIKFLMVQRKHSLGYMEFMRGHYDSNNIESICHLLEQMTSKEIAQITNKDFEYLWNSLWNNNPLLNANKNKFHVKEFISSKQKFYEFKINNSKYLQIIKPIYNFNEWGFPKGRRETYETDIVCAMREFEEETNYCENEYHVFDESSILKENLVGTNGINYRHNYFIAFVGEKKNKIEDNKEIGDMNFFSIDECLNIIRPYHNNKQNIIKKLHNVIMSWFIENSIDQSNL
jgi:hypothetical protein